MNKDDILENNNLSIIINEKILNNPAAIVCQQKDNANSNQNNYDIYEKNEKEFHKNKTTSKRNTSSNI